MLLRWCFCCKRKRCPHQCSLVSFCHYILKLFIQGKGIDLQTCPIFTLITLIFTRKKLIAIIMERKRNKLKYVRDKKERKIKMVNIIFSSFQFCFESGERSTCFCFTCKVVPNAYPPVGRASLPRGCPQQGNMKICF